MIKPSARTRRQFERKNELHGFALPTVLILSIILLAIGVSTLEVGTALNRSLIDQHWNQLAKAAAQSGVTFTSSCLSKGVSSWSSSLVPNVTCSETAVIPARDIYINSDTSSTASPSRWRSTYVIAPPIMGSDSIKRIKITGIVEVLTSNNEIAKTYTWDYNAVLSYSSASQIVGVDTIATTKQTSNSINTITPVFSTTESDQLLVAFISLDGPDSPPPSQSVTSVTGAGLTWTMRQRANAQLGSAEIWTAVSPTPLSNVQVNARKADGNFIGFISVVAFSKADTTIGASTKQSAANGAAAVSLTATRNGSWVWGIGDDWQQAIPRTVLPNQDMVDEYATPPFDTYWLQRLTNRSNLGDNVTIGTSAPTVDRWNFAAIEILPKP